MGQTRRHILRRHAQTLKGRLRSQVRRSEALGIRKPYYVYEAPGLREAERAPLVVLLRGHEREWVNMDEDDSRERTTAIEDVDRLVRAGVLPPLLAVMPGLNSADNHVPSLGIDMVGRWPDYRRSLGSGRFWSYLTGELLPGVEAAYPQVGRPAGAPRIAVGFSLGGYTVSLLALRQPGWLDHAAIYDGTLMWPAHNDPREEGEAFSDPIWSQAPIFDAALGRPRHQPTMRYWNPTARLHRADRTVRRRIKDTTFWVACAAAEGSRGNRDRAHYFARLLKERGAPLGLRRVVYAAEARHTWHWADGFLQEVLLRAIGTPDAAPPQGANGAAKTIKRAVEPTPAAEGESA
jgi:enterochelin esterase-like enzyme